MTTQDALAWSRIWTHGTISPPPLAAIGTASRGTELFSAYQVMGSFNVGAWRNRSNVELKAISTGSAGTADSASSSAASGDGGTTIDVFWRNTDKTIGTRQWNGSTFVTPTNVPQSGQALAGVGAGGTTNRVDIFIVGTNHSLFQNWRGTGAWAGWSELGTPNVTGGLASLQPAVLWVPTSPTSWLEVFSVAADGSVWMRRNQNNPQSPGWDAWQSLGGNVRSGLAVTSAVTSSGAFRVDVFAVDTNGDIQRQTSSDGGSTWNGWTWIGRPAVGLLTATIDGVTRTIAPTAVARGEGVIDLFVRDANADVQLMTIRPVPSLSGGTERSLGTTPPTCANVTSGENTAAATSCDGGAYDFLLSAGVSALRVGESCLLDGGAPPSQCGLPSGPQIANCAPYQMSFPNSGLTLLGGSDNQMARLSDGSVIALSHQGICSSAPCAPANMPFCNYPACGQAAASSGDLIYRTTAAACGTNWTFQGVIDICKKIETDPTGSHGCYNWPDSSSPTGYGTAGGDRPEMAVRHPSSGPDEIYVTEAITANGTTWGPGNRLLFKSTDNPPGAIGTTWTQLISNPQTAVTAQSPIEITTVGSHVLLYGRDPSQSHPVIWSQTTSGPSAPWENVLSGITGMNDLQTGDTPSIDHSVFSIAQAGSSVDGDYIRVVYPTVTSGHAQVTNTGLFRVNSDETVTQLSDSFVTICAGQSPCTNQSSATGSILYPTLVEADRMNGPSAGDERPPVVLYWVETTKTPPASDPTCVHGPYFGPVGSPSSWTSWLVSYDHRFADVDGDGRADIVGRLQGGQDVRVGLSTGAGFAASTLWKMWDTAYDMQLADVNGGGRADIIGRSGANVRVGLSTGSGFATSTLWTTWDTAYDHRFADVDGDGRADIIGRSGANVRVGLSTGSGFAASTLWTTWDTAYDYRLADVNGDGRADIIGRSGTSVRVGLSTGTGFAASTEWAPWGWSTAYDLQLADVNGDRRADGIARSGATVKVALSTGTSFSGPPQWTSWDTAFDLQVADVNGDGLADAVGRSGSTVQAGLASKVCDWGVVSIKATVFRGASQSRTYTIDTADSSAWRGNGDYVHGASRYTGGSNPVDRFFLHWYNDNSGGGRMPMARLVDVVR